MPSRRPHTKTRNGCLTCKARKVRCGFEKPACRNCLRGDRVCAYPDHLLAIPPASTTAQEQVFPLRDLELLHHWTCFTYTSVTDNAGQYSIWQVYMPRVAFTYRFLLHGMLALAALHRRHEADVSQQDALAELARYHQQHALSLYIPLLHSIDEHNCHALFAFSIVFGALSFGLLHGSDPPQDSSQHGEGHSDILARFVDAFDAFMGATAVGIQAYDWLVQGPMQSYMVPLEPTRQDFALADPAFQTALEDLVACAHASSAGPAAYVNSIYGLGTILAQDPAQLRVSDLVAWPVVAEAGYIALLKQRDPLALVVLGHYGTALHLHGGRVWMLEGLGKRLTEAVFEELDEAWRPRLAWAVGRVAKPAGSGVHDGSRSVSAE